MKRYLPLLAIGGLLAACGDHSDCKGHDASGYCNHGTHHGSSADALSDRSLGSSRGAHNEKNYGDYNSKTPMDRTVPHYSHGYAVTPADAGIPNYRPDGVYYVSPAYEQRGYQPTPSDDALSDRPLGSSRGTHNEPMTSKDMDHDGQYDYVPYYAPRRY